MTTLQPLGGSNAEHSFAYWGERQDWLVALTRHRDSDDIDRSNWTVATDEFERLFENEKNEDWAIESTSHWAVGWLEYLLVRPDTESATLAQGFADRLANYPLLDDEHHSMLEYDEQWCVRCDRGMRNQHPLPRCTFRSESERDDIRYQWEQRAEARRVRRPILTVTCGRCGEQIASGLLDFENHMRAHEFGGKA